MKKGWRFAAPIGSLFLKLTILFSVLLCSCSVQNQRAELIPNPNIDLSIREAFLAKDFIAKEWKNEKWWTLFDDEQLSTFIETALEKSPTLDLAEERIKLAHQTSKLQFSPLLPEVDMSVQEALAAFSYRRRGLEFNEPILPNSILPHWLNWFDSLISFKWNIDLWGKQKRLYQAALDETKMQIAETAHQKLLVSIQVAKTYFNLQYFLTLKALQEKMSEILVQKLELTFAQVEHGIARQLNVDQIEKQLSKLQICMFENEDEIAKAKSQLGIYLSLNPEDIPPVEVTLQNFNRPFPFPSQISMDLLSKRADIVARIWAVQACTKRVNSAKVAFFPSIDLASFSGYFALTYKEIMKPRAWFTSILPGATLPLFHGLKLKSKLHYMLHQYNYAVYEYNDLLVKAAKEVVDSVMSFRLSQEKIEEQEKVLKSSRHVVETSLARYENGLNTLLEVIDSEYDLLKEETTYTQLIELRLLTILNLVKSIGGGYENKEAQVDLMQDFIYE